MPGQCKGHTFKTATKILCELCADLFAVAVTGTIEIREERG